MVAFDAVAHRDLMKPEGLGEHPGVLPVTARHVHPDQRIRLVQQLAQLVRLMHLQAVQRNQVDVHDYPPFRYRRRLRRYDQSAPRWAVPSLSYEADTLALELSAVLVRRTTADRSALGRDSGRCVPTPAKGAAIHPSRTRRFGGAYPLPSLGFAGGSAGCFGSG